MLQFYFSKRYTYGAGLPFVGSSIHGFVLDKAQQILNRLNELGVTKSSNIHDPQPFPIADLNHFHTPNCIDSLNTASGLAEALELPMLAILPTAMVQRAALDPQLLAAGATLEGLRKALSGNWCFNLSGGFHHAAPDNSHGFCLINDLALAVATHRSEGRSCRLLVLDLDLHQGDGNAIAFQSDDQVFTVSMHEEGIFPFPKAQSDVDWPLDAGLQDDAYLAELDNLLGSIDKNTSGIDAVVYIAGSDPFVEDPLGSLNVSAAGMANRDRRVAEWVAEKGLGLLVLPGGGYTEASPVITADGYAEIAKVWVDHKTVLQ